MVDTSDDALKTRMRELQKLTIDLEGHSGMVISKSKVKKTGWFDGIFGCAKRY